MTFGLLYWGFGVLIINELLYMVTERESKLWLLYSKKHKNISMTAGPLRLPPEPLACQVLCQRLGNQRWMKLGVCLWRTQSPGQRGSQSEDGGGPTWEWFREFYVGICVCKGVGERIPTGSVGLHMCLTYLDDTEENYRIIAFEICICSSVLMQIPFHIHPRTNEHLEELCFERECCIHQQCSQCPNCEKISTL